MKLIKRIIRGVYYRTLHKLYIFSLKVLRDIIVVYKQQAPTRKLNIEALDDVLVIAPHPDDEVFGCGMLVHALCEQKKHVNIIILSRGEAALPDNIVRKDELIAVRKKLAQCALTNLGVDVSSSLYFSDFPDGNVPQVSERTIMELKKMIRVISPKYVFLAHPQEASVDHVQGTEILQKILEDFSVRKFYFAVWLYKNLPLNDMWSINFKDAFYFEGDLAAKKRSIDIYMNEKTSSGYRYSCTLPEAFLRYTSGKREIFFES